ncbi:hypothetical protein; 11109-12438 [Arabidopsis thaliana]|uniref:Protein FAR1-RELATED SEQUENCE n=1 Tax=Arabidopsis thaliana TaxID=3702 RepID=Q9C854_ARATH|nr:hypothetical protein; 11109-12438 [Arabidopsis thaliana]
MAKMEKRDVGAVLEYFQKKREEEDLLLAWSNMLQKHNLTNDKWLKNLFELREKCAMHSYNLLCFSEHSERVLEDQRYKELVGDFNMMHTSPVLCATVEMLEMLQHAEEVYIPEICSLFQKQYIVIGDYVANKVSKSEMFSFAAILCRHASKVLDKKNVRRIPSTYILNRWSKEAKAQKISSYHSESPDETVKQSIGNQYSHICRTFRETTYVADDHIELTLCAK